MADWSQLIPDLLVEIAERMSWYPDLITFGSVCTSWKAAAMMVKFRFKSKVPWLMHVSRKFAPKKFTIQREFFRQGQNLQITLPEANGKKCLSSRGWLMTIGSDWGMNLLHPFSGVKIKLPHIRTFKHWKCQLTPKMFVRYVYKFLLSADPSLTSNCMILVIFGGCRKLAYCRPGDKSWITIEPWEGAYYDLTCYKGTFYAMNAYGRIIACEIPSVKEEGIPIVAKNVAELPIDQRRLLIWHFYLVESSGSLLVVCRKGVSIGMKDYKTYEFKVFKVDITNDEWREVKSLDDRALFLGHSSSFSVNVSNDTPLKPNHIYFTDDCCEGYWATRIGGGRDMGIYSMQHKSIEPYFKGESYNQINPPMWVDIAHPWLLKNI